MKKITRDQAEQFILAQQKSRAVNFLEDLKADQCGCMMVHLGKHLRINFDTVDNNEWYSMIDAANRVAETQDWQYDTWGTYHKTYETLQTVVKALKEGKLPPPDTEHGYSETFLGQIRLINMLKFKQWIMHQTVGIDPNGRPIFFEYDVKRFFANPNAEVLD